MNDNKIVTINANSHGIKVTINANFHGIEMYEKNGKELMLVKTDAGLVDVYSIKNSTDFFSVLFE